MAYLVITTKHETRNGRPVCPEEGEFFACETSPKDARYWAARARNLGLNGHCSVPEGDEDPVYPTRVFYSSLGGQNSCSDNEDGV